MADIHRLPNIKEVEREASEWIARLNADDVSADDLAQFELWLRSSPLHARTYEELLDTWRKFTQASQLTRDTAATASTSRRRILGRALSWRQLAMAMGGVAAALVLGFYIHLLTTQAVFQTTLGERVTVALPDGSTLQLNSDSRVRVDYSLSSRVIHLERGEAFVNVVHDSNRPFWVTTGETWVRAVGTAFGVHLNRKGVRVTVHEGIVKLGTVERFLPKSLSDSTLKSASAVLAVGEQADLEGRVTTTRKLSSKELARNADWRDGWLYIENENLCDVIAELDRYSPRELILEDVQLCSLAVGGSFQASPKGAEALLSMLEGNFDVRIHRDGDSTYIRGDTKSPVQR